MQEEVLTLISEGLTREQVARHLGISYHTVKTHMTEVFNKLGVQSSPQAVRVWLGRKAVAGDGFSVCIGTLPNESRGKTNHNPPVGKGGIR